jgi:hypothetical protein
LRLIKKLVEHGSGTALAFASSRDARPASRGNGFA